MIAIGRAGMGLRLGFAAWAGLLAVSAAVRGRAPALVEGCSFFSLGALGGGILSVRLRGFAVLFDVPSGFAVEERRLGEDRVVVILSAEDSFKVATDHGELVFCGRPLDAWLDERGLDREDVLDAGAPPDLFAARLFCCRPSADLVAGYLTVPGDGWAESFRAARRLSMNRSNASSPRASSSSGSIPNSSFDR